MRGAHALRGALVAPGAPAAGARAAARARAGRAPPAADMAAGPRRAHLAAARGPRIVGGGALSCGGQLRRDLFLQATRAALTQQAGAVQEDVSPDDAKRRDALMPLALAAMEAGLRRAPDALAHARDNVFQYVFMVRSQVLPYRCALQAVPWRCALPAARPLHSATAATW
jgi:hypothetical protein